MDAIKFLADAIRAEQKAKAEGDNKPAKAEDPADIIKAVVPAGGDQAKGGTVPAAGGDPEPAPDPEPREDPDVKTNEE